MFDLSVTVPAVFNDKSLTEGIKVAGEVGITGVEFFDWESHGIEDIESVCNEAGVSLAATLSAGAGSNIEEHREPAMTDPDSAEQAKADIERSIDACELVDCPNLIVTVGPEQSGIDRATQFETVVDVLNAVAPRAEAAGVTLVIEPLNIRVDHPDYFLSRSTDAFELVMSVDSSNVKVLFDVYHQQVTEGDVTRRLTENIDYVGHVHIADNPGRHELGTGELNYENVLASLADTKYEGYVGCEFIPRGEPSAAIEDMMGIVDEIAD